jgi:hypothetical protein
VIETLLTLVRSGRKDVSDSAAADVEAILGDVIGSAGWNPRIQFLVCDLPQSDACFAIASPAETTETFCDGLVRAFTFFDGVPKSIPYELAAISSIPGCHSTCGDFRASH